jgi:Fe-S cluster assembly protein SufD
VTETPATAGRSSRGVTALPHSISREAYRSDFDRLALSELGGDPAWLVRFRAEAMESFETLGFPTMKDEDWHFTSVAPIADRVFHPANAVSISRESLSRLGVPALDGPTLVFVNGYFSADLSSAANERETAGVTMQSLAAAIRDDSAGALQSDIGSAATSMSSAFTALNAAFFRDGALIRIAADGTAGPIHLVFVASGSDGMVVHPRNIIVAGRHAQATIIESYVAADEGAYFTNAVTEVMLGEGARVSHYKLQSEGKSAFHVGTIQARQPRSSYYESFCFTTGGDLSRTNVNTILEGDSAECVLNGLYLADGTQHTDHQTFVEHIAPNCPSHELYKGILDGRSHGVFNGKVYVHPEAQKTDGKQSNNNLLLSDHARVDTKPQLEIFADDVKCTHGATVGRLDETALFYLRSRGLSNTVARKLLTYAFAADVLERLTLAPLREALEARVLARFTG